MDLTGREVEVELDDGARARGRIVGRFRGHDDREWVLGKRVAREWYTVELDGGGRKVFELARLQFPRVIS